MIKAATRFCLSFILASEFWILTPALLHHSAFIIHTFYMTIYHNFINGAWVESESTRTVQNINPANTDDLLGTIRQATRDEARRAVESASAAFRDWRTTPAPTRGRIVARAARLMEDHKEELAQLLTREEGKTISESRGELQRSINVAEFCAGESRRMNGETIQSELPST